MHSFNIRIANHVLRISTPFKLVKDMFVDFLSNEKPEIDIVFSENDIIKKRYIYRQDHSTPIGWKGEIDISLVLQKIADELIQYDVFLIHGAAISVENTAFIFSAPSGTGKTTHIRKWLENCRNAFVVNGDKPFIEFNQEDIPLVCGSPWAGKEEMYTNSIKPLKSIIILERAEENSIEPISFSDAFPMLLHQIYRPDDITKMQRTLKLLQRMSNSVSFFRFYCNNMKEDCFQIAYDALMN